jgi:hypothetical protein
MRRVFVDVLLLVAAFLLLLFASALLAQEAPTHTLAGAEHPDGGGKDVIRLFAATTATCKALHKDAGRATYTYRDRVASAPQLSGSVIEGCYVLNGPLVYMIFEDGDRAAVPLARFTGPGGRGSM